MKKPTATFEKVLSSALHELPASFSREVGKIIVRWAYFELCLQKIIWLLADVDDETGRYAIREPRVTDRIDMISDLALVRSVQIGDEKRFKDFWSRADKGQSLRDLLAHGLWVKYEDGSVRVVLTRGHHPKQRKQVPFRNRKLAPDAKLVTQDQLQFAIGEIDRMIGFAVELERAMRKQLPPSSRRKSE